MEISVKHHDGKPSCIVLNLKGNYTIELYTWDGTPKFISEVAIINEHSIINERSQIEFSVIAHSGNMYLTFDEVLNKVISEKDDAKIFEYIKEECIKFIKLK